MQELPPQPDPTRTLLRAVGVLIMMVIAFTGMIYAGWYIWHLPR